eukprot:g297.t1
MDVAGQQKMREQMEKEAAQRQEQANRQQMLELIPLVDEANKLLGLLNRPMLKASAMLRVALSEDGSLETPEVKVRVENVQQDDVMYLDPYEFTDCVKVMKNEIGFLVAAYENNQEYESTQDHDPFEMVYSSTYEVGTAMIYLESCAYFLETEADEAMVDIKSVGDSNVQHGQIEVRLTPLPCDDEENPDNLEIPDIEDTKDLIGLPWNYKLEIVGCVNMSMVVDEIRCEYVFNGVHYSTPPLTVQSDHPHISYSQVLHVDKVTPEFVNMLEKTMLAVRVMVSPYSTNPPKDRIATSNPAIAKALGFGGASLREQVDALREENAALKKEIAALKEKLGGGKRGELAAAQAKDESLNG